MGQYYRQINLNKLQCLYTHAFGDGLKLMEFGASGNGTMAAMAILLCPTSLEDFGIPPTAPHADLAGSWAGDHIVIAGDYADSLNTTSWGRELLGRIDADAVKSAWMDETEGDVDEDFDVGNDTNAYSLCDTALEDISDKMIELMAHSDEFREGIMARLERATYREGGQELLNRVRASLSGGASGAANTE